MVFDAVVRDFPMPSRSSRAQVCFADKPHQIPSSDWRSLSSRVPQERTLYENCLTDMRREGHIGVLAEMIGTSPAMQGVFDRVRKAAPSELPGLTIGETGTGNALTAQAIHAQSRRHGWVVYGDSLRGDSQDVDGVRGKDGGSHGTAIRPSKR